MFFVRFTHPRVAEVQGISVLIVAADREFSNGIAVKNGLWSHTAQQWGDTLKIKVTKGSGRNVFTLLETVLIANPEAWPQVVPLPDE